MKQSDTPASHCSYVIVFLKDGWFPDKGEIKIVKARGISCQVSILSLALSLQLPFHAFYTNGNNFRPLQLREYLPISKIPFTTYTPKALVVVFPTQSLDILTNDRTFTLFAFRRSSFSAFGLATQTPGISILLDVGHSLLEGIATFRAEEMPIVPMLT